MYKTVPSLQKCCANFICHNLDMFTDSHETTNSHGFKETKLVFRDPELCLNADVSDLLLSNLSEMNTVNNAMLLLFDPAFTALHHVIIPSSEISDRGLSVLKHHQISQLELPNLRGLSVCEIIACLGDWTLSNLRILNVSNIGYYALESKLWALSLSRLKTLHTLNVSFTNLNQEGLEVIAENLLCLAILDISGNNIQDISPLRECRHRLKSLTMYNMRFAKGDPVGVICELSLLVHLDVSSDKLHQAANVRNISLDAESFPLSDYLFRCEANPSLVSLDVSGAFDVQPHILKSYLEAHKGLKFIGLALTSMCEYEIFEPESPWYSTRTELKVAGNANIPQLLESLRRYVSRTVFILDAVHKVFNLTKDRVIRKPRDSLIEAILPAMKAHRKMVSLQLTGTACLANLLRDAQFEQNERVHPTLFSQCVHVSLRAMDRFREPKHYQLHRNILLILCNNIVVEDATLDRLDCLNTILKCIGAYKADDSSLHRMSMAVCSVLIRKISREEVATLVADARNVRKLLDLVREGFMNYEGGITLRFTLAALWSLTDECPEACCVFVAEGGVEMLMELLRLIDGKYTDTCVELRRKCLGVLSNIAETDQVRHKIIQPYMVELIRGFLLEETLDVSYLAADIVAHLCTESETLWASRGCNDRDKLLQDLETVVLNWDKTKKNPVTYRTFRPFYILLQCEASAVKLYSLWAIHSFCTSDGDKYLKLLDSENGCEQIQTLMNSNDLDPKMKVMCQEVLDLLEKYRGSCLT